MFIDCEIWYTPGRWRWLWGGLKGSAHTVLAFNLLAQSFPTAVSPADRMCGLFYTEHIFGGLWFVWKQISKSAFTINMGQEST